MPKAFLIILLLLSAVLPHTIELLSRLTACPDANWYKLKNLVRRDLRFNRIKIFEERDCCRSNFIIDLSLFEGFLQVYLLSISLKRKADGGSSWPRVWIVEDLLAR
ncbi:unnamed protein product [Cuscuta epithymum]|uniref:Uncharacterized protein n=1 Tax=Cuscuta epithymum TaxID=186058 RepID=A0AAV0CCP8_9ASTE|nr:unnamed protein product [Cuscuta epithymum]